MLSDMLLLWQATLHLFEAGQHFIDAHVAITQKLESVADCDTCGDLLFSDDHPLSEKIVQKLASCESDIKKS